MCNISRLSNILCSIMGCGLQQEYVNVNGVWWLYSMGKPQRELSEDEVQWHIDRNHKPFAENGINKDDPKWWEEPNVTT